MRALRKSQYTSTPGKTIPAGRLRRTRGGAALDWLVVSAWAPELAELQDRLPELPLRVQPRLVLGTVGVGLVDAAIGAATLLTALSPRAVLFIGTAGVYPGSPRRLRVGSAAVARRIALLSASTSADDAYFPDPMTRREIPASRLGQAICKAARQPDADIACPLAITATAKASALAAKRSGCALENLEAFSVARAAASLNIPFAAVLGIANHVGEEGHREWKRNAAAAAAAACRAVAEYLGR
jgi:nucleoside phosphorylase